MSDQTFEHHQEYVGKEPGAAFRTARILGFAGWKLVALRVIDELQEELIFERPISTGPQWILTKDRPHPLNEWFVAWHDVPEADLRARVDYVVTPQESIIGWLPLPQQGPSDE